MIFSKRKVKNQFQKEQQHNEMMKYLERACKTYHIVRRKPLRDDWKHLVMKMYDCIKYKIVN